MFELILHLEKWQTLYGAILGGIFALSVALLVAYKVRRSSEIAAAMSLVGVLSEIIIADESLKKKCVEEGVSNEIYPLRFVELLLYSYPKVSPLFESSIVNVMPSNNYLAAHLTLFHAIYKDFEIKIERLSVDFKNLQVSGAPERRPEHIIADMKKAYENFQSALPHAKYAKMLLDQIILGRYPTWYKIRFHILPTRHMKDCKKLLETGK